MKKSLVPVTLLTEIFRPNGELIDLATLPENGQPIYLLRRFPNVRRFYKNGLTIGMTRDELRILHEAIGAHLEGGASDADSR